MDVGELFVQVLFSEGLARVIKLGFQRINMITATKFSDTESNMEFLWLYCCCFYWESCNNNVVLKSRMLDKKNIFIQMLKNIANKLNSN